MTPSRKTQTERTSAAEVRRNRATTKVIEFKAASMLLCLLRTREVRHTENN